MADDLIDPELLERFSAEFEKTYQPSDELYPVNIGGMQSESGNYRSAFAKAMGTKAAQEKFAPAAHERSVDAKYRMALLNDEMANRYFSGSKALANIPKIEDALKKVGNWGMGPAMSRIYDAELVSGDEDGKVTPPDWIDALILNMFPKETRNLKNLDESLGSLKTRIQEVAGKTLSKQEIPIHMNEIPNVYQNKESFKKTLENYKSTMTRDQELFLKQLLQRGFPQSVIERISQEGM